jgi:hypothetical protein
MKMRTNVANWRQSKWLAVAELVVVILILSLWRMQGHRRRPHGALAGTHLSRHRRNLSVPIIAHGLGDSIGSVLIFLGKYPGT